MDTKTQTISRRELNRILLTAVAPRPIGWISTIGANGYLNLAPFSFYNILSLDPPLLGFSVGIRSPDVRSRLGSEFKDTLRNIRCTSEFVVNIVTYPLAKAMVATSGDYEESTNEFEVAKLTIRQSKVVMVPQVAESPISFECTLHKIVDFGTYKTSSSLVIGEVVSIHIEDAHLRNGRLDASTLNLIGRMGAKEYTHTSERFEITIDNCEKS
jgi:flavin reductase (DIM6/NTAB) family NADH-FMN oxidoreductase RutF